MTIVDQWAVKLAEAAVPDEIDLAPAVAEAYQQGGESRQSLYIKANSRSVAGAFGASEMLLVLPWIFKGIALAAQRLLSLLGSDELGNTISVVKEAIALRASLEKTAQAFPAVVPVSSTPAAPELKLIIDVMGREMRAAGLTNNQADLISFRVVDALLEDRESGAEFVNCLYGAES